MPRLRVIILEREDARTFQYALWADVPAARQSFYANANKVSAWNGALPTDNTALQNGSVVERVDKFVVPSGTTLAVVQTLLQTQWQEFQDRITALNPWVRYGSTWDGAVWTAGGVA